MTTLTTTMPTGTLILLLPFLLIAMATDIADRRIPNVLIAFMLGTGVVLHTALLGVHGLAWSLGGMTVGFLMLLPFHALGGMGGGDVKLLAAAGSFLGPWGALLAAVLTFAAGGLLAVGAITWQKLLFPLAARYTLLPRRWSHIGMSAALPYSLAIGAGTLAALYLLDSGGPQAPISMEVASW